jgi:hypothetical protein
VRPAFAGISILASILLLGAVEAAQYGTPPPAPKPQTAAKRFKNIKVLTKLPADQLIPVMQQINRSLGVRCSYCHVVNPDRTGFERDDKPMKGVARGMIRMVNDINAHQKILDGKATCYMCHHGHAEPETLAPAPPPPPSLPGSPLPGGQPGAQPGG